MDGRVPALGRLQRRKRQKPGGLARRNRDTAGGETARPSATATGRRAARSRRADPPRGGRGGGGDRWALEAIEALVAAKHELPPRTQLVLEGLVGGKTQREIAVALGVSETTVWNEVQEIRGRTGEILEKLQDSGGH
ncbi:MAG: LuxR C-terminal-related transcriptional regulator [Thermoguttaceae bacterium]|nr:LuxR C-terminal-related transcriptional regulator [Thermoguttaceae bacterium]